MFNIRRIILDFRRTKGIFGRMVFITFMMGVTIALWLMSKADLSQFQFNELRWLMQISGLLGMVLFTLNFLLATRARFLERWFGGLDVIYKAHHLMGGFAYIFMLLHFGLLLIELWPDQQQLIYYLTPKFTFDYTFGSTAFWIVTILLALTYYKKVPYHIWKGTHIFMGVALLFAGIHVFLVPSDVSNYLPLRLWMLGLIAVGLYSAVYRRFIYKYLVRNYKYTVSAINTLGDIVEVTLTPENGGFNFWPAQYVFIKYLSKGLDKEMHPYSISKADRKDGVIRLSMKKSGDYTNKLGQLKVGDKAVAKGPYGEFGERFLQISQKKRIIWIAGGIGVTPFLSMIDHLAFNKVDRAIDMFYSVKEESEAVYADEIKSNISEIKDFKLYQTFSNKDGRLTFETVKKLANIQPDERVVYMICGPKAMMNDLEDQMLADGVHVKSIIYEDFTFLS